MLKEGASMSIILLQTDAEYARLSGALGHVVTT
jgi:hypothetical protein